MLALADEAAYTREADEASRHLDVLLAISLVPNPFSLYVVGEVTFLAERRQEV